MPSPNFLALSLGALLLAGPLLAGPVLAQETASGESGNVVPPAHMVSTTVQDGPKAAEHLRIGIWSGAGNVTTYTIGDSWNDWMLWLVFDKLREPSPYVGKAEDWLATSVTQISDDARVWEIKLRDGVKWHDGTDFTAEDVAFTFEYYREGPANRWTHHASAVPRIEEIEVIDRLTLRLTSQKPMPNFDRVTAADLPIIQKAQWERVEDPRSFTDLGIGTGPYRIVYYVADQYYEFEANENYWRGKPLVDKLTLVMIKDPQTMFTALKTGEIDGAARSLPPELVPQWRDDPSLEIVNSPTLWGTWLDINVAREPFAGRDVRQAISLAINPEPLLERIMLGMGQSGVHGWPHVDSFWTRPDLTAPYDPAAANAILDEKGFLDTDGDGVREDPEGNPLNWSLKVASNQPLFLRAAEMLVPQFKEIGVNLSAETLDPASLNALWANRDFDLRIADITPHGIADQDMELILYQGDAKNELFYDEEKAAITERWLDAETRQERLEVSYELQEYQTKYPVRVMLWYPDTFFAHRWESYDNYNASAGYGVFHKYSFLPNEARGDTVDGLLSN